MTKKYILVNTGITYSGICQRMCVLYIIKIVPDQRTSLWNWRWKTIKYCMLPSVSECFSCLWLATSWFGGLLLASSSTIGVHVPWTTDSRSPARYISVENVSDLQNLLTSMFFQPLASKKNNSLYQGALGLMSWMHWKCVWQGPGTGAHNENTVVFN